MRTTGLSGNEIYCLDKIGYKAGDIVVGNSVHSLGVGRSIGSAFKAIVGGEITQFTDLIEEGRASALNRMEKEARDKGAVGITGVSSEIVFHSGNIEFLSIGSSLHTKDNNGEREELKFSTSSDGQDAYAQVDAGYDPLKFVFGNVAYSIGITRGIIGAFKTLARGEVREFSDIFNKTRHLALERIIKAAQNCGANSVVGIETTILPLVGTGLQEMLMIGTASKNSSLNSNSIITSDMEFKIKTALMPEVTLSDYKKIAKKEFSSKDDSVEITDKEIDDVIQNIRENLAHEKVHAEAGGGEHHNHRKIEESDLPDVNDDFAKMLGSFESLAEMKAKIKENLAKEKEMKAKDKRRTNVLEKIITDSKIDLPKIVVDGEMEKMLAQFKDDIAKSGISYEDYLKHIKKTEDDLRAEWKEPALKRAKSQIILNTIAKDEGISPKEEDVKREMELILAHYKEADRFRVRMYVETFLTNEMVFKFLENQN